VSGALRIALSAAPFQFKHDGQVHTAAFTRQVAG
jgi:hypothetical protein